MLFSMPIVAEDIKPQLFESERLSIRDFERLGIFIEKTCGIKMPASKLVMVESRLRKRMKTIGLHSFKDYCRYLFSPGGEQNEWAHMIDVITTNKTDFFREPHHFKFLLESALPELLSLNRSNLRLWSAGCSTGEEPYTLAMVLSDFASQHSGWRFSILATDISTRVLQQAVLGIYKEEKVLPVPPEMKLKYLLRSRDKKKKLVRMTPQLRSLIEFRRVNFMDDDFGIRHPMEIIFCRNVLIYFDGQTQEKLLKRFCKHLVPGGYLFIGSSETLSGMNLPLKTVGQMVYRKLR